MGVLLTCMVMALLLETGRKLLHINLSVSMTMACYAMCCSSRPYEVLDLL